jgi:integrase
MTGYVFRFLDGRPLNVPYVSYKFTEYVRAAEFPDEYTFLTLRLTGASRYAQKSAPLSFVKEVLGHSPITTTMCSAHSTLEDLCAPVRLIDDILRD